MSHLAHTISQILDSLPEAERDAVIDEALRGPMGDQAEWSEVWVRELESREASEDDVVSFEELDAELAAVERR